MKYFIVLLLISMFKFTIAQRYIDTMISIRLTTQKMSVFRHNHVSVSWLAGQLLNNAWVQNGYWVGYMNVTNEQARTGMIKGGKTTLSQNDLHNFHPQYRPITSGGHDDKADEVSISFPKPPRGGSPEEAFLKNALLDLKGVIDGQVDGASASAYYNSEQGRGLYEKVLRRIAFIQYCNSK